MVDEKRPISQLPDTLPATPTDTFIVNQGATTRKETRQKLRDDIKTFTLNGANQANGVVVLDASGNLPANLSESSLTFNSGITKFGDGTVKLGGALNANAEIDLGASFGFSASKGGTKYIEISNSGLTAFRGSGGEYITQTFGNSKFERQGPSFSEYWNKNAPGNTRVAVGMLGHPEANLSMNMYYELVDGTAVHKYYDSAYNAMWLAISQDNWYMQWAPSGQDDSDPGFDIWYESGSKYLIGGNKFGDVTAYRDLRAKGIITSEGGGDGAARLAKSVALYFDAPLSTSVLRSVDNTSGSLVQLPIHIYGDPVTIGVGTGATFGMVAFKTLGGTTRTLTNASVSNRLILNGGVNSGIQDGGQIYLEGVDFGGSGAGGNIRLFTAAGKKIYLNSELDTAGFITTRGDTAYIRSQRTVSGVNYESYFHVSAHPVHGGAAVVGYRNITSSLERYLLVKDGVFFNDGTSTLTVWHSGLFGASAPAATDNTVTNKIPISIGGTTYYILASTNNT